MAYLPIFYYLIPYPYVSPTYSQPKYTKVNEKQYLAELVEKIGFKPINKKVNRDVVMFLSEHALTT